MVCHVIVCVVCNFLDIFHFCKDMECREFVLSPRFWFLITDDWMTQTSIYIEQMLEYLKILVKAQAELYLLLICRHGFPASTLSEVMQGFLSGGRGRGWRNLLGRSPSLQPPPRARQLRQEPTRPIPMFPGRSHISYLSIAGLQIMSFMKVTGQTVTLDSLCNPSQYVYFWESMAWCIVLLCKDNNICRRQGRSRSLFRWAI